MRKHSKSAQKAAKAKTIELKGAFTIYEATRYKRVLLEALEQAVDLEINLSKVSEIDTAGVQLLVLAKREAIKQKKALRLTAHSQATLDAIDMYALGGFFGDPVIISSAKGRSRSGDAQAQGRGA